MHKGLTILGHNVFYDTLRYNNTSIIAMGGEDKRERDFKGFVEVF